MGADGSRVHVILLHRCSVNRNGMRVGRYFPDLGRHTTLTAESNGASEALMITFCAWYWAAFCKIDRKVTDEGVSAVYF